MPVVVRIPSGGGIGAVEHHSESPETLYAHTAGLKVVTPATPADAYSLLRQSIELDDPVIFLEPKRRYWARQDVDLPVTTEPIGRARVLREGGDCTLVAYGPMVKVALDSAQAAEEEGLGSLEVIDLRSIVPLDDDTLIASASKTGRMVVVHEAPEFLGVGAEIAARVTEAAFLHMEAPVLRCAGLDIPYPPARLEEVHLPSVDRVLWTVQRSLDY
jgi:pyruvate dehydrogenase E1 component beta subunit